MPDDIQQHREAEFRYMDAYFAWGKHVITLSMLFLSALVAFYGQIRELNPSGQWLLSVALVCLCLSAISGLAALLGKEELYLECKEILLRQVLTQSGARGHTKIRVNKIFVWLRYTSGILLALAVLCFAVFFVWNLL